MVTINSKNLVKNSLLSIFCSFMQAKDKNQIVSKLVVGKEKYFGLLLIVSRILLQRHDGFNRLFIKDILRCYSCLCYNSMRKSRKCFEIYTGDKVITNIKIFENSL